MYKRLYNTEVQIRVKIWFCVDNRDKCQAEEFIKKLAENNADAHDAVKALLDYSVEYGPPKKNEQKFKRLRYGVFEFKTNDGVRLFCYQSEGGYVITHAAKKPQKKFYKNHINKTLRIKKNLESMG